MSNEMIVQSENTSPALNLRQRVAGFSNTIVNGSSTIVNGERSIASIALLASLVAAVIVLILWTSAKSYVPLYGNQEHYDKASIVEVLENEELPFRIDSDSGNILVPQNSLADARILLSARGVKAAMPEGLSTIQDKVNMGTSQFMETKQYQHALEGELAHTIISMEGIRNSRVHLALPKRSLFIGRREEAKAASVFVDLVPGYTLAPEQVEAIVSLVAGSVPGLDPKQVSVVDQTGQLLSGEIYDDSPIGKQSNKKLAFKQAVEAEISQSAKAMLMPILGEGNFRIEVATEIDFNVVEATQEEIDPEAMVQSENVLSDSSLDKLALGIPGALSNRPPQEPAAAENPDDNQRTNERNETTRKFEHGRSVTHTRYDVGRVITMSVSVLLNDSVAPNSQWEEAALVKLGDMVKAATGFQDDRGDRFNISSFPFIATEAPASIESVPVWQMPYFLEYIRYAIALLISTLLLFFGVRPLVNNLVSKNGKNKPASTGSSTTSEQALSNSDVDELIAAGQDPNTMFEGSMAKTNSDESNGVVYDDANASESSKNGDLSLPELGSEFEGQMQHMRLLASKEPERVTAVIKDWVERGMSTEKSADDFGAQNS